MEIDFDEVRHLASSVMDLHRGQMEQHRFFAYARHECVLECATDRAWTPEEARQLLDEIQLLQGFRIQLNRVEPSPGFDRMLFAAVRKLPLDAVEGEMSIDCDSRYRLKCPLNWFDLDRTEDERTRHCGVCDRSVVLATTESERQERARAGHCVAFRAIGSSEIPEPEDTDMGYEIPIEELEAEARELTLEEREECAAVFERLLCDALEAGERGVILRSLPGSWSGSWALQPLDGNGRPRVRTPSGEVVRPTAGPSHLRCALPKWFEEVFGPEESPDPPPEPLPLRRGDRCIGQARIAADRRRIYLTPSGE